MGKRLSAEEIINQALDLEQPDRAIVLLRIDHDHVKEIRQIVADVNERGLRNSGPGADLIVNSHLKCARRIIKKVVSLRKSTAKAVPEVASVKHLNELQSYLEQKIDEQRRSIPASLQRITDSKDTETTAIN